MLRDDPDRMAMLTGGQTKLDANKDGKISGEDFAMLREENKEEREEMQEGGMMMEEMPQEMDEQMKKMLMEEQQVPDEEMEEDYLDFIINEALTPEEEDFLVDQLRNNDELSEIFDKVIEVASEFTGSGPVEGPGTEVSDSIPARLSDGEFVFTAKATEEIGEDKLMSMMKEAEANADERQEMMHGGIPHMDKGEEQILSNVNRKQVVNTGTNVLEEDETSKNIKGNMYNPNVQDKYVRS